MKPAVWGTALGALVVAGGAYAFVSHQVNTGIIDAIDAINTDTANGFAVSYTDFSASPFSGTVTFNELVINNTNSATSVIRAEKAKGTLDLWNLDEMNLLEAAHLEKVSVSQGAITFSADSASVRNLDIEAVQALAEAPVFSGIPVSRFEMTGFKMNVKGGPEQNFGLRRLLVQTSDNGNRLDEFLYEGFAFKAPQQQVGIGLEKLHLRGGDLGFVQKLMDLAKARTEGLDITDEDINKTTAAMVDAGIASFGFEKMSISGFKAEAANGLLISLKDMYVKDIERVEGLALGATYAIEDLEIKGLKNISPQAAQMLTIAEMEDLRLNMASKSGYDKTSMTLRGDSAIKIDDLINLDSAMAIEDVDLAAFRERMRPLLHEQYKGMVTQIATGAPQQAENPQEQMTKLFGLMARAYTGFYSTAKFSITLEDQGLNKKGLALQSAMTGMQVEQLRQQLTAGVTANLVMLLGPAAPADLASSLQAYLAEPSQPLRLTVQNTARLTEEVVAGMNQTNWHQYFNIEMASGAGIVAGLQ
ncbi:MAG: hypothetical protein HWE25_14625 [Alphaproteobacteria bacterium]|nr:hypothetical protein [Alphaproteobacteria bacterium]